MKNPPFGGCRLDVLAGRGCGKGASRNSDLVGFDEDRLGFRNDVASEVLEVVDERRVVQVEVGEAIGDQASRLLGILDSEFQ
jgi:hypothetical protein